MLPFIRNRNTHRTATVLWFDLQNLGLNIPKLRQTMQQLPEPDPWPTKEGPGWNPTPRKTPKSHWFRPAPQVSSILGVVKLQFKKINVEENSQIISNNYLNLKLHQLIFFLNHRAFVPNLWQKKFILARFECQIY